METRLSSSNPLSVAVDDIILVDVAPLRVVKVFSVAEECVEVRASNGLYHHVYLDHRKEDTPPPLQYLERLVKAMVKRVREESREAVGSFLKKTLFTAMRDAHGCIIAVTGMRTAPGFLASDGIMLADPIDFQDLVRRLNKGEIDSTILANKSALVRGMLQTDGITLFDDRGRLLGYNCFVKVRGHEPGAIGGARRRAYTAVTGKIGRGVSAAFMQSQDGGTAFEDTENAK
jgi:hypothetical protein